MGLRSLLLSPMMKGWRCDCGCLSGGCAAPCCVLYLPGDEGADALAAAVASSSSLKKLNLSGNPISTAQLEVVQHVLKTREYKL